MRILLISKFRDGGVKVYFQLLLEAFEAEKLTCLVDENVIGELEILIREKNLDVRFLPFGHGIILKSWLEKFDQIIVSTGHPFSLLYTSLLWPRRVLYILHTYPVQGKSRIYLKRFVMDRWSAFLAHRFKRIITVSKYSASRIASFLSIDEQLVQSLPTPCRFELFASVHHYHQVNRQTTILTIGHLEVHKNPDFWLRVAMEIVGEFPNVRFQWVGTGHLFDRINSEIPNSLRGNMFLLGNRQDIYQLLMAADIYFHPSKVESQGLAVLEAMFLGLPCVTSTAGGLPEMVEHGKTGYLFNLDNTKDAVDCLRELIINEELRSEMSLGAKDHYRKNYSFENWKKALFDVMG